RVSISIAAFDTQYAALPGMAVCAAPEEMLITRRRVPLAWNARQKRSVSTIGAAMLVASAVSMPAASTLPRLPAGAAVAALLMSVTLAGSASPSARRPGATAAAIS